MEESNYTNFIRHLDSYDINEPFIKGEYEILRQSILNNYINMNLDKIPQIKCDYKRSHTNDYLMPFYSLKLIKTKEEQIKKDVLDLSLNPPTNTITKKTKEENIDVEINSIDDLINVLNAYKYEADTEYNIDLEIINDKTPLTWKNKLI